MTTEKIEEREIPIWLKRSKEEVESLVLKLIESGMSIEKAGLVLRDTYGIPSTKIIAGKITEILEKHNIKHEPPDLMHLQKKLEKVKSHLLKNKQDKVAKRGFQITASKIRKLEKYYNRKKKK